MPLCTKMPTGFGVDGASPAAVGDLSAVLASATDAIVTADESGRILSWNPAAGRIFGYTAEEAVGRPLTILIPEKYREAHDAGIARVVETGETRVIGQPRTAADLLRVGR